MRRREFHLKVRGAAGHQYAEQIRKLRELQEEQNALNTERLRVSQTVSSTVCNTYFNHTANPERTPSLYGVILRLVFHFSQT